MATAEEIFSAALCHIVIFHDYIVFQHVKLISFSGKLTAQHKSHLKSTPQWHLNKKNYTLPGHLSSIFTAKAFANPKSETLSVIAVKTCCSVSHFEKGLKFVNREI